MPRGRDQPILGACVGDRDTDGILLSAAHIDPSGDGGALGGADDRVGERGCAPAWYGLLSLVLSCTFERRAYT